MNINVITCNNVAAPASLMSTAIVPVAYETISLAAHKGTFQNIGLGQGTLHDDIMS